MSVAKAITGLRVQSSPGALWPSSYTNKITLPPRNGNIFLGCSRKLSCPFHGASSVRVPLLSEELEVPWVPAVPSVSLSPPPPPLLPGDPREAPRTPPPLTHTARASAAPASPDVGHEGLDVPRQHGHHVGDDEGGRGPADEQSGHASHAGQAAQHGRGCPPGARAAGRQRCSGGPAAGPLGAQPGCPGDAPLPSLHFRFSAALPAPDGGGARHSRGPLRPSPLPAPAAPGSASALTVSRSPWGTARGAQPVSPWLPAARAAHAPSGQGGGR